MGECGDGTITDRGALNKKKIIFTYCK